MMNYLKINFNEFHFIDFGSGKGRVLLLASNYGFNKVIGVEFAQELHFIAKNNISICERNNNKPNKIESICEDATNYNIPNCPLNIFFNSPFIGFVLKKVLGNISTSFEKNPREIYLIFYGQNPSSIEIFKTMTKKNFHGEEIKIDNDWTKFLQLRCFFYRSSGGYNNSASEFADEA